jgi:putative transposase
VVNPVPVSIKQRLYPTPDQEPGMLMHCHHHRLIYNTGLTQRQYWTHAKRHYKQTITTASQMRELAAARQDPDLDWLKNGSSVVHQGALRDLDRAYANFFAGRAGYPRPKRKHAARHVFTVRDLRVIKYNRKWAGVHLPKIGYARFRLTRPFRTITAATSARVTLHGGHWHISFTTTPAAPVSELREPTGAAVGIDRGVANSVATSDGEFAHAPGFSAGEQERFLALQRRLSRQRNKASKRRARTRHSLAVMHRRLRDRRKDWIEQTTTRLASVYDRVVLEDLNTTGMTKRPAPKPDPAQAAAFLPNQARAKAALNRAILASCWGGLATRLRDKTTVITINPRHTSQECRMCGHTEASNRESQAVFCCRKCGHAEHADANAACVILQRGLEKHSGPGTPGDRAHKTSTAGRANPSRGEATAVA